MAAGAHEAATSFWSWFKGVHLFRCSPLVCKPKTHAMSIVQPGSATASTRLRALNRYRAPYSSVSHRLGESSGLVGRVDLIVSQC